MPTSKTEVLRTLRSEEVKFLRLQFTDLLGVGKNVEVPISQFEKALDGQITIDGSSIEGFTRSEESDMLLQPDYATLRVFPAFSSASKKRVLTTRSSGRKSSFFSFSAPPRAQPRPSPTMRPATSTSRQLIAARKRDATWSTR